MIKFLTFVELHAHEQQFYNILVIHMNQMPKNIYR